MAKCPKYRPHTILPSYARGCDFAIGEWLCPGVIDALWRHGFGTCARRRCNSPMEEIEPPTEQVQEEIHHHAHESRERWVSYVALSSALIAALAAVCALLAGHHANHAMIEQLESSDQWAYYQAKGIEQKMVEVERNLLKEQGKTLPPEHAGDMEKYEKKREQASEKATEKGK